MNGRFSKAEDGFTSISNKGMSVVDYIITPIKPFRALNNFRVIDPYQVAVENSIALDSSMPDHRIISVDVALNSLLPHNLKGCNPYTKGTSADETKVKIKTMPENYLLDPTISCRLSKCLRYLVPTNQITGFVTTRV